MSMEEWWDDDNGKLKYSEITWPSATLSATIPWGLAWEQTQASTPRHQQLTTWAMTWPKEDSAPWSWFNYVMMCVTDVFFVWLFSEWSLGSCWMGSWPESAGDTSSISSSCPLHSSEFFLYIYTVQATNCSNINTTCTALQIKLITSLVLLSYYMF